VFCRTYVKGKGDNILDMDAEGYRHEKIGLSIPFVVGTTLSRQPQAIYGVLSGACQKKHLFIPE
jgi:hypothetical protein